MANVIEVTVPDIGDFKDIPVIEVFVKVGNGYEKRAKYIPGNWFDAIDAFWRASILKEYFGKPFVDTYCTVKEVEADRFYAEPTLRDFEWYLRAV